MKETVTKKILKRQDLQHDTPVDFHEVLYFLGLRRMMTNGHKSLLDMFHSVESVDTNVHIMHLKEPIGPMMNRYKQDIAKAKSCSSKPSEEKGDWKRAYHATSFQSLYAILTSGVIVESSYMDGQRCLYEKEEPIIGVYVSKDVEVKEDVYYCTFTPLIGRCMWGAVLELLVDRNDKIKSKHPTQWMQPSRSILITGLRFHGVAPNKMQPNKHHYQDRWISSLEIPPSFHIPQQPLQGVYTHYSNKTHPHIHEEGYIRQWWQ